MFVTVDIRCCFCNALKPIDQTLASDMEWVYHHGVYACPQCIGPAIRVGQVITQREIDFLIGAARQGGTDYEEYHVNKMLKPGITLTQAHCKIFGRGFALTKEGQNKLTEVYRAGEQQNAMFYGKAYPCPVCHRGGDMPCIGCEYGDAFGNEVAKKLVKEAKIDPKKPTVTLACAARTRVGLIDTTPWQYDAVGTYGKPLVNMYRSGS